ncbi:hypothetical protein EYF80_009837 [Liparis tanakae]|uniref:Uncharacterized protein n=1 Tax=Liparis tanakae TaxID=230148 RepID=A0A4Z2IP59_9TELE|nr:hypothetical protein EYF80_009837 [Liparis tanakae]
MRQVCNCDICVALAKFSTGAGAAVVLHSCSGFLRRRATESAHAPANYHRGLNLNHHYQEGHEGLEPVPVHVMWEAEPRKVVSSWCPCCVTYTFSLMAGETRTSTAASSVMRNTVSEFSSTLLTLFFSPSHLVSLTPFTCLLSCL